MKSVSRSFLVDLAQVAIAPAGRLTRVPLLITGQFSRGGEEFSLTEDDAAAVARNFRRRQCDLVVDYECMSEFPALARGEPIPAAGWLQGIDDGPDERGILWGLVSFTARARGMIANGRYKCLSTAVGWRTHDKRTGELQGATLTAMALIDQPDHARLRPLIVLAEPGWQRKGAAMQEFGSRLIELARQKIKDTPGLTHYDALRQAIRENPEIAEAHRRDVIGRESEAGDLQQGSCIERLTASEVDRLAQSKIQAKLRAGVDAKQAVRLAASENKELFARHRRLIGSGGDGESDA